MRLLTSLKSQAPHHLPRGGENGNLPREGLDGVWYTLDGRKLNGKPTQKGLYIVNGRKTIVK